MKPRTTAIQKKKAPAVSRGKNIRMAIRQSTNHVDKPAPAPSLELDAPRPMVAIVGRPNVGKSMLFNKLAGKNIAIVHDRPGVTRDRLVALCKRAVAPFDIMDTGGIGEAIDDDFNVQVQNEAQLAMKVADVILFVVDGIAGITPVDLTLVKALRKTTKPLVVVVNKMDTDKHRLHAGEFTKLGFKETVDISAAHGRGITELVASISKHLDLKAPEAHLEIPYDPEEDDDAPDASLAEKATWPLKLAIIGRPNAGKSSLINAVLKQDRTIVSDIAGTTRDSIDVPCKVNKKAYILIDTAGLRRKAKIHDEVETFSAGQATRSIRRADLCLLMIDCAAGISMQDRKIAQIVLDLQKPCIIVLNKFDLYEPLGKLSERTDKLMENARREFFFMPYAPIIAVSAKQGQYLNQIFRQVERIHEGALNQPGTGLLNRIMQRAISRAQEPLGSSGKAFNLLYATIKKDKNDRSAIPVPHFILFGNRAEKLQDSYLRYVEARIRDEWPAEGVPFKFSIRGKAKKEERAAAVRSQPTPKRVIRKPVREDDEGE